MLKLDLGTLALSAAMASIASAVIVVAFGFQRGRRREWPAFAVSAALYGAGVVMTLYHDMNDMQILLLLGNLLVLLSAIALHVGFCRLADRRPPLVLYVPTVILLLLCYLYYFQVHYSVDVRIACVSLLRVPIFAHALFLLYPLARRRVSPGLMVYQAICAGWTAGLLLRAFAALFLASAEQNFVDMVG
jgi:hypothetical protein